MKKHWIMLMAAAFCFAMSWVPGPNSFLFGGAGVFLLIYWPFMAMAEHGTRGSEPYNGDDFTDIN